MPIAKGMVNLSTRATSQLSALTSGLVGTVSTQEAHSVNNPILLVLPEYLDWLHHCRSHLLEKGLRGWVSCLSMVSSRTS